MNKISLFLMMNWYVNLIFCSILLFSHRVDIYMFSYSIINDNKKFRLIFNLSCLSNLQLKLLSFKMQLVIGVVNRSDYLSCLLFCCSIFQNFISSQLLSRSPFYDLNFDNLCYCIFSFLLLQKGIISINLNQHLSFCEWSFHKIKHIL